MQMISKTNRRLTYRRNPAGGRGATYLHVQISPISFNVVGSILHVLGKNTDTTIVGYRLPVDESGGTPRPVLLTGAKKSGVPD